MVIGKQFSQERWLCRTCQRGGDVLDFVAFKIGWSPYFLLAKSAKAEMRALAVNLNAMLEGGHCN